MSDNKLNNEENDQVAEENRHDILIATCQRCGKAFMKRSSEIMEIYCPECRVKSEDSL